MSAAARAAINDRTVASALHTLMANGAVEGQSLDIISLEAVRTNLADRWPSKSDQVWNQVEKFLRHEFGPDGLVLRLDDVNVLVVQPGRSRLVAQARCVSAAHDLIRFFLGSSAPHGVLVKTVESVIDSEVVCIPLPQAQIDAALLGRNPSAWESTPARKVPLLTPMGRELSITLSLTPVLTLQGGSRTVGYAARTVLTDVADGLAMGRAARIHLQSSDLAGVDRKVLATAFSRRVELPRPSATLIVPVAYATLANSSTRYGLLEEVHHLSAEERRCLVWEIIDFEPGVPAGRVAELVAIARPHCRGVICRMDLNIANAEKLKAAGATLSVQIEAVAEMTEYGLLKQEGVVAQVLKLIPAVMFRRLPPTLLPVAHFIGVTHCTVAPPG